jgi:hypothetical protein
MQNANKHALSWKAGSGIDEGGMAGQGHNAGHAVAFFRFAKTSVWHR